MGGTWVSRLNRGGGSHNQSAALSVGWELEWNGEEGVSIQGEGGGAPFNPFAFQSPPIPMLFFRLDAPVLLRLNNNSQAKDPFDRALQMKFNWKLHQFNSQLNHIGFLCVHV